MLPDYSTVETWLDTDYAHKRALAEFDNPDFHKYMLAIGEIEASEPLMEPDSGLAEMLRNAGFSEFQGEPNLEPTEWTRMVKRLFRKPEGDQIVQCEIMIMQREFFRMLHLFMTRPAITEFPLRSFSLFGYTITLDPPFALYPTVTKTSGFPGSFVIHDSLRRIEVQLGELFIDGLSYGFVPIRAQVIVRDDEVIVDQQHRDPLLQCKNEELW